MDMKKFLAAAVVGAAFVTGVALQAPAEANYGMFDMTGIPRHKKTETTDTSITSSNTSKSGSQSKVKPSSITSNRNTANYNLVNWSMEGTIKLNGRGLSNVGIYVVEYSDGGETPKYHMEGNTMIFENISKAQAVSFSRDGGKYVSLDFKAPSRINILMFASSVGMRYFSLNKTSYLGKYDYDFGNYDDTASAVYHEGLIK